ncbi:MAG: Caib/baif family protein [Jatrophihabitantaceae bacterium]|nr:Caib/baif family protein [Jatrophihabitantaceae bacterium]
MAASNDQHANIGSVTLSGLRVLDLGDRASTAWCGRLLADIGADVIGAEPPAGHMLRADPPAAEYLLANRRRADFASLDGLVPNADVVIVDDPAAARAARHGNPTALIVAITPYGLDGPLADRKGNDLTAYASSGWASMNGLADREPLKGPGHNASFQAGTFAWAAVTATLLGDPAGELLDIAERDVLTSTFSPAILREQYTGSSEGRRAVADVSAGPVPVADGYFALPLSRPHFWQNAMRVLGLDDLADVPGLQTMPLRNARKEIWLERVQDALAGWKKLELFDALAAKHVTAGPVLDMADLEGNPQLVARGFFRSPEQVPDAPAQPGPPARYGVTQWHLRRPAPSTTESVKSFEGTGAPLRARTDRPSARPSASAPTLGPLAGYRGLVLTQAWAGTYATQLLAQLGAEIVQVENRERLDIWRGTYTAPPPAELREAPGDAWDLNPLFNSVNMGKRSITLNLATAEGLDLFRRLVPRFDFVVENFSPRVMGKLGLGYDDLRKIREDIVLVSMSAYGATGPWAPVPGIGGTIEPSSGMSALLGYEGGQPLNSGQMYPDPVAGLVGLGAILTALLHRRRTGEGQYVDMSMQEACATFIGDEWMRYQATGIAPGPRGNRNPAYAPHGIYPTAGDDQWAALAAPDDATWAAVVSVLGTAVDEPRFATAESRQANEDALDAAIGRATAPWDKTQLADALAAAGAIAAPLLTTGEVTADPSLSERRVLRPVTHFLAGEATQAGLPLRMTSPLPEWTQSPLHGADSFGVLHDELGLDEATYAALDAAGITGSGPVKQTQPAEETQ